MHHLLIIAVLAVATLPRTSSAQPERSGALPTFGRKEIMVVPFGPPTSVVSWDEPTDRLGAEMARAIVAELQQLGHVAVVVPEHQEPQGDKIVRGRLLRVNGGSRAKRFWLGFGGGRASLSAEGTVTWKDGADVARFRERRSASGEGEANLLSSNSTLVDKCLRVLARDIATMIDTGKYREASLADEAR
jgi:hypothetical protein